PAYLGLVAPSVDVKVVSDDVAGVLLTPTDASGNPDGSTLVDPFTNDFYTVRLTRPPVGAGATVSVQLHTDGQELISSADGRFVVTTTFNTQTFDASSASAVNLAADTIAFASPHGFVTGEEIIYQDEGGTPIGGLTGNQTYWVIKVSDTVIKLA